MTIVATVNPKKVEHGLGMIGAAIPYALPLGHEDGHVPTWASTV